MMDFCSGLDLKYAIRNCFTKGFPAKDLQILILKLLRGLNFIHRAGVYHRDLKPANIIVRLDTFEVRYIDFGISKLLQTKHESLPSDGCGTPGYRPPEVVELKSYDGSADVFALGCCFYYMATG
jgi:serine/threonine protein kinase